VGKGLMDACITLKHIWEHGFKGDLGEDLKQFCSGSQGELRKLQAFAESLMEPVSQMETGLIHSDVYPENTGWRRGKRELLILDLEWIGFGPRFYDAASLLGAPDELQPHHRKRDELARYYMERYARWGGEIAPLSEFMREISALWIAQTLGIMWFRLARALDGQVDWTEDREQGRRFFRDGLKEELSVLMRKADRY
jgi:aminoglycoside/choline kinase family phosphotransferase